MYITGEKLLIILADSGPGEFSYPLFHEVLAAAVSLVAEVGFTGFSAVFAAAGHAENGILNVQQYRTVYDSISEARQAGIVIRVITPALECGTGD